MNFPKGGEQNSSAEVFRIIEWRPRTVYELEDLNKAPIEGQIYVEELIPERITKQTTYKIDKILDTRVRCGIQEYLVRREVTLRILTLESWHLAERII